MIAVSVFTVFLVVIFSVVSARPWNQTAVEEQTKNLQECEYFQVKLLLLLTLFPLSGCQFCNPLLFSLNMRHGFFSESEDVGGE